jgi:CrcB protein
VVPDEHERPLPHDPDLEVDEGPAGEPRPVHLTPHLIGLTFVGGCLGVLSRALLERLVPDGTGFPGTTFAINVTGALILAVLIESLALRGGDVGRRRHLRLLLGTGVLGGYTTYSALAVQTDALVRAGEATTALTYAVGTVVLGFAASVLGIVATRRWGVR